MRAAAWFAKQGKPPSATPKPATAEEPPGLSARRIKHFAERYQDAANGQYAERGNIDKPGLDRWLRKILAAEVLPEFVEVEFERVMKVVFAV